MKITYMCYTLLQIVKKCYFHDHRMSFDEHLPVGRPKTRAVRPKAGPAATQGLGSRRPMPSEASKGINIKIGVFIAYNQIEKS